MNTNPKEGSKISFKYKAINLFCLTYLLIWTLVPAFSVITNKGLFRIFFAIVLILWVITAYANLPSSQLLSSLFSFGTFVFVLLLYFLLGFGDLQVTDIINYIILFGFSINGVLYTKIDDIKIDKFILYLSLLLITITTSTTIYQLFSNANASRLLTSSSTSEIITNQLRRENIGAFDFIYGLVILFPLLVNEIKSGQKKHRLLCLIFIMLIATCVIKSNFTTALLLLFAGFFLTFLFPSDTNPFLRFLIFGLIVIAGYFLLPVFLRFVYSITTSILAKEKIEGLLLFLEGSVSADNVTGRVSLFKMSLSSFLKNPFWGVGGYYGHEDFSHIGRHAQFIDDLGRYGLLGGIPLYSYLVIVIKGSVIKKQKPILKRSSIAPSLIIFFFLGFLNPIYNYGILSIFFVVTTTLARCLDREKTRIHENKDSLSN